MPHAQCLCVQYQVVPNLEETANRLRRWVEGGEDAGLEQAFGEWKAQKWPLTHSGASGTMKLSDEEISRSLGAKAKNYNIYDPATGGILPLQRRNPDSKSGGFRWVWFQNAAP